MARSVRNENASRTTESAAAAVGLSLSMFEKICTDATCVLNGMFPEMRMTAPNSPTARAKASATPERMAGTRFGRITRRKIVKPPAPREAAASSISRSSSCTTGCTERTTKGSVTKRSAATIAHRVYAMLIPMDLLARRGRVA